MPSAPSERPWPVPIPLRFAGETDDGELVCVLVEGDVVVVVPPYPLRTPVEYVPWACAGRDVATRKDATRKIRRSLIITSSCRSLRGLVRNCGRQTGLCQPLN